MNTTPYLTKNYFYTLKTTHRGVIMNKKIITLAVLAASTWLALQIGTAIPLLGSSISAILIGAIIRHTPLFDILDKKITKFVSSYLLKTGIVLLGFTLSLRIVSEVGVEVLVILAAVIASSILTSILANKFLKVPSKLSLLIGLGTSICGGSAIVAAAPIIDAEDEDIAVSVTTMFIYSMLALFILPSIGALLQFTDQYYGILAGAAVNDTASVVATSFAWSDYAGGIATVVKLTRTLFIVPVTLGLIYFKFAQERKASAKEASTKTPISWNEIKRITPLFVVFFVLAVLFATFVPIDAATTKIISKISKLLMTISLVSIGFGVHIKQIKKAGLRPVLLGAACWATVVSISVILIQVFY